MTAPHDTRFLVVGAGGLGGPVSYALAAAGAASITVCDDDVVDLSNLQRQIQFTTADVGRPKVQALGDELTRRGYASQRYTGVCERFSAKTAARLLDDVDVVIDGSDNFVTKFAVNDVSVAAELPFVIGGVLRYTGQVLAAIPGQTGCYRCVFEAPPEDDDANSCAQAGVLGAVVGVIGGELAAAALALAAGDASCAGSIRLYNDIASAEPPRTIRFNRRPGCGACDRATMVERTRSSHDQL